MGRRTVDSLTLLLALFSIVTATVQTILPRFFDSGYPVIDWFAMAEFSVVGAAWLSLAIAVIRPNPAWVIALATTVVFCGLILAPVILSALMYQSWFAAVLALGCPVAFLASARAYLAWDSGRE